MNPQEIQIENYTYNLPAERIAKYPLAQRDESKLLVYNKGEINHCGFKNVTELIPQEKFMVVNNTKVIQARLHFFKDTGARIEIFCLEPHEPSDFVISFQQNEKCTWKCIVGNSKKWKTGSIISTFTIAGTEYTLIANRIDNRGNSQIIEFVWEGGFSFSEVLENAGKTPIPPYLNRKAESGDKIRYQTVYSQQKGSVAAPTAGLHFTENVLNDLRKKEINIGEVTLHVGAGTFTPVKSDKIGGHEMHIEHFFIEYDSLVNIKNNAKKILAVGTTSVRTLESLYWLGVKVKQGLITKPGEMFIDQWEAYQLNAKIEVDEALDALIQWLNLNNMSVLEAATRIIIVPGYKFRLIDCMITNFHQPRSTLLLLIAAFVGDNWKKIYDYALENNFRFLSYGDSSILMP